MAVTMLDIARDLKVSVVTVSKVLRNKGNISVATWKRVLRRAKKLNYQNWIAHPFFAEIAKAVAETVRPRGYHVIISYFAVVRGTARKSE
jgi:LacI family transcriptional regulator